MDLDRFAIVISGPEWFFGIVAVFLYAFILVHFINNKTDAPKTAHPLWFYILCFVFAIFYDGFGHSNMLVGTWFALWGGLKSSVIGQGFYAFCKAIGLVEKIEAIMAKKFQKVN